MSKWQGPFWGGECVVLDETWRMAQLFCVELGVCFRALYLIVVNVALFGDVQFARLLRWFQVVHACRLELRCRKPGGSV